ncbi:GntR family transcriptional regulator [Ruegeria sp. HKCCD8929]|uniref:GntR family transcriptional regulator n=1 Tax=Ruegeria sp. HKCCD8929 TaxID=2683006 RepID=UPI00148A0BA3|nr:GntR family transcriptional regulator [Ruegeria sp. HKCCD8929]
MNMSLVDHGLDRTQPIPKQLYEILRRRIVANTLQPGERISEAALAQEFDVSRTPLRAALQQLATEGLVTVRPQVGTLVAKLDVAQLNEAVFIRSALECAVVEKLARESVDLSAIEHLLSLQAVAADVDDYATFFQHDEAFHAKLAELAGTPTSWKLVQSVKGHVDRQRYTLMAGIPMRSQRAFQEHQDIVNCIRAGDVAGASKAMAIHVASVLELEQ